MSSTFHALSAAAYESFMGRWSRRLSGPFIEFAAIADGETIIDVGCGTGSLTNAIADAANINSVVGIDLSEVYLEHARRVTKDPRIAFSKGDATALDFPAAKFDRAMSLLVLQFVPEADRAIREMKRVVRPGGVVAAAVWDGYGGIQGLRMFWDVAASLGLASEADLKGFLFRPMSRPGELAAAWTRHGLIDVVHSTMTIRMEYASFADYWGPIASGEAALGKFATSLAQGEREWLEKGVRLSYLGGMPDGPRSFAATAWVCKGRVP